MTHETAVIFSATSIVCSCVTGERLNRAYNRGTVGFWVCIAEPFPPYSHFDLTRSTASTLGPRSHGEIGLRLSCGNAYRILFYLSGETNRYSVDVQPGDCGGTSEPGKGGHISWVLCKPRVRLHDGHVLPRGCSNQR